jgi:hypothetical protein
MPDEAALRAMAWLRDHTDPLAPVCVAPAGPGRFLPAVANRASVPAEVPPVYREEAALSPGKGGCRYRAFFGPLGPESRRLDPEGGPAAPAFRLVYEEASAVVQEAASPDRSVTSFDKLSGNPPSGRP